MLSLCRQLQYSSTDFLGHTLRYRRRSCMSSWMHRVNHNSHLLCDKVIYLEIPKRLRNPRKRCAMHLAPVFQVETLDSPNSDLLYR